jgi:hypothetical protein
MLAKKEYCVGDIFKVFDKELSRDKFVVLSRFVLRKEHFVLLSMNTYERWADRELAYDDEFVKTRLTIDEVIYLAGDENITYVGNSNSISKKMFAFIDESFALAVDA